MKNYQYSNIAIEQYGNRKGLTIIELVVVIVVLGLAIPPLLTMWANVAWRSAASEFLADSAFYAQTLMEEIKSKNFDENASSPWSAALGPEGGETYPNYNDVDDFNGYTNSPAAGYTRSAAIDYVRLSGSTWTTSASATDYKRIVVTISRASGHVIPVTLTALVSAH